MEESVNSSCGRHSLSMSEGRKKRKRWPEQRMGSGWGSRRDPIDRHCVLCSIHLLFLSFQNILITRCCCSVSQTLHRCFIRFSRCVHSPSAWQTTCPDFLLPDDMRGRSSADIKRKWCGLTGSNNRRTNRTAGSIGGKEVQGAKRDSRET